MTMPLPIMYYGNEIAPYLSAIKDTAPLLSSPPARSPACAQAKATGMRTAKGTTLKLDGCLLHNGGGVA